MSEMVERAARAWFDRWKNAAIARGSWGPGRDGQGFDDLDIRLQDHIRADARFFITAIREPTEAMVRAWVTGYTDPNNISQAHRNVAVGDWQAMIDAALAD